MDYKNKYLKYKNKYLSINNQTGGGPLHDAIINKDIIKVTELLDAGSDVNEIFGIPSYFSYSPLQLSIKNVDFPMVNLLLERGANFNYIGYDHPGYSFGTYKPLSRSPNNQSCLSLAYLNFNSSYISRWFLEIIYSLFNRGVIIDNITKELVLSDYKNSFNIKDLMNSWFEEIDQAKNGNIEYFKKLPLMIFSIQIWVNYLPESKYQELLLWAKTTPDISTLFGKTLDKTKSVDYRENRETVASSGLMSSNIIDFVSPDKKNFYNNLLKFKL